MGRELTILVGVDNIELRSRIVAAIEQTGFQPQFVGNSNELLGALPASPCDSFLIIDTNDDVAKMVQLVNDVYRVVRLSGQVFHVVVFMSSKQTLRQNPSLKFWLIDGHAAVAGILTPDMVDEIPFRIWAFTK